MDEAPTTPDPNSPPQPIVEGAVLPDNQTPALPAIPNPETDQPGQEQTLPDNAPTSDGIQTQARPLAADALKAFLTANNLVIELPEVKTRQIQDGSLIIDLPKNIIVKYGDE